MRRPTRLALCAILFLVSGCMENSDDTPAKSGALLLTCGKGVQIFQWHGQLYYRETSSYEFRQVLATKDDVCSKFESFKQIGQPTAG